MEGKWQLAVRTERSQYSWDQEEEMEVDEIISHYDTPLLKCSRDISLLAAEDFDALVDGLKDLVTKKLGVIERAEKLAKPE